MLRSHGLDARSVVEQRLAGASDERLAVVCREERRALLTLDVGFADVRAHPPHRHAGVIVLRLRTLERRHVLARVGTLALRLLREELAGQLWVVGESSVRVRR